MSAAICARMVAYAAPLMPSSKVNMKRGSRMALMTTVAMVADMATWGCPVLRKAELSPK